MIGLRGVLLLGVALNLLLVLEALQLLFLPLAVALLLDLEDLLLGNLLLQLLLLAPHLFLHREAL